MPVFVQTGRFGSGKFNAGVFSGRPPSQAFAISIAPFSRDKTVFDSGWAMGANAATIPLSGTTDAPDGTDIEVQIVDADTGAQVVGWQTVATASGGTWSGDITGVQRNTSWLRPRVRAAGSATVAQGANSFGVGLVLAVYEQSNTARATDPSFSNTTPQTVTHPDDVQIFTVDRTTSAVTRTLISDATPLTAAMVSLANAFSGSLPGHKMGVPMHVQPGTSPQEMVDNSNSARNWSDEVALHTSVTADGSKVGLVTSSWIAWDATERNVPRIVPVITGKLIDGTVVVPGTSLTIDGAAAYVQNHSLSELYDFVNETRFALIGAQGRGKSSTQADYATTSDVNYEQYIDAWKALSDNANFTQFLPHSFEMIGGQRGVSNGSGGWTDTSHHAGNDADGLERLMAMMILAVLRSANLVSWPVPKFDRVFWDPAGNYVDYWMDGYDVTTKRLLGGLPAIPATFAHRDEVMGFTRNGTPVGGTIVADAGGSGHAGVRIASGGTAFDYTDVIENGPGAAPGILQFPEDYIDKAVLNLPVVDVGQGGLDALPVAPRTAAALGNTLPAPVSFTTAATEFTDPNTIGSGRTVFRLDVTGQVVAAVGGVDRQLAFAGPDLEVIIRAAGVVRVKSSGTTQDFTATIVDDQVFDLSVVVDLVAGTIAVTLDGGATQTETITTPDAELPAGRDVQLLHRNSQRHASGTWSSIEVRFGDAAGANSPYKPLPDPLFPDINADPWKVPGSPDAT